MEYYHYYIQSCAKALGPHKICLSKTHAFFSLVVYVHLEYIANI